MLRLADILTAWYILSTRSLERFFSIPNIRNIKDAKQTSAKLKRFERATGDAPGNDKCPPTEESTVHSTMTNPWVNKEKPEDLDAWMMAPLQELSNCSISRMSHHRLAAYVQSLPPDKQNDSPGAQVSELSKEIEPEPERHSEQETGENVRSIDYPNSRACSDFNK